jgi:hypothetical protein
LVLTACQGLSPVFDTVLSVLSPSERNPQFSTAFEYLQVELDGRKAFMALGRREMDGNDVREFWYSGQREMLQLFNGRIEIVLGMTREARLVNGNGPNLHRVIDEIQTVVWQRSLDMMPGYQFGVSEFLTTTKTDRPRNVPEDFPSTTQWISETVQRQERHGRVTSYQQLFALQQGRVVYSEQCLAFDMCFKLKYLGFKS